MVRELDDHRSLGLENPHHGTPESTSPSQGLNTAAQPGWISCGSRNVTLGPVDLSEDTLRETCGTTRCA